MVVASANYSSLALIDISFRALQPVFLSTPIALGGLGLDPPAIGIVMSFFGILNGVVTVFFFSRMTDHFGVKRVYLAGVTAGVPCFALFPIINHLARNSIERSGELGTEVWVAVGLQVAMAVLICMCYGMPISKKLWYLGIDPAAHPFQPQCLSSSPAPHLTKLLWELRMVSLNCRYLSCARSDPPWRVRCFRCRLIKIIII